MSVKTQGAASRFLKWIEKISFRKKREIADYNRLENLFKNKKGLEIGGPSKFFMRNGYLPVYTDAASLDNLNFSSTTIWTGTINEESGFLINNKQAGKQYIADATDLSVLKNIYYDFILSCNNIEHIANPLKAVEQWLSVLNKDGAIVIIAPRKESNFDHNRDIVKFDHLMSDYIDNTNEHDLTHLEEILQLHDLKMDRPAGTIDQFRERSLKNFENRCLHHHVFDLEVLKEIYRYFGLSVIKTAQLEKDYLIIGTK